MKNSEAIAAQWIEFIVARPEFPLGESLRAAFLAGTITRLCDCGCNSFEMDVPDDADIKVLASPGRSGAVFEIEFRLDGHSGTLEFILFVDRRGHFSGIDVHYCGNTFPIPEDIALLEPPHHVRVSSAIAA